MIGVLVEDRRENARRVTSDAGFSMVELLVYIVLSMLVMAVLAGIMLNGLHVQKTVQSIDTATETASVVTRSVEQGIGNADGVGSAAAFSVGASTAAGQLLQARTAVGTTAGVPTWSCRAWYYSATNSSFYTTNYTGTTLVAPTTAALLATWSLLGTGVSVPTGGVAFSATSATLLKLSLTVASTGSHPVIISTTEQTTQSDSTGAPTACF